MITNRISAKLLLMALLAFLTGSCTEDKENIPEKKQEITQQVFRLAVNEQIPNANRATTSETITKAAVYMFNNDLFYKAQRDITPDASGNISLSVLTGSKLYFLSSIDEPSSLLILEEGKTTLTTFLALSSDIGVPHTATQAPGFYSGIFALTEENKAETAHTVQMTRAVARFDLDTSRDPLTKINRIIIENAAATVLLFPGTASVSELPRCSYERTFAPPFSDGTSTDLFRIYESNKPVKVTAYGTYQNLPIVVKMELPIVERNKIYKIVIQNVGAEISGIFEVKPWEEGGTVEGFPDATEKIVIDKSHSTIPENVTITENLNEVKVPNSGTSMTLAFRADTQVNIATTDGLTTDIQITPITPVSTPAGVVSKFHITVAAQGKGRLPYHVILNMKSALQNGIYDQVRLSVAASDYQIEEVTLGGVTWMAFNARTRELEDQTYVLDGCSVEDMYKKNWLTTIGGLFQWGRLYMYTPWASNSSNMGGQSQNSPWSADTHVPCPVGYRIPTPAELRALLPNDQSIPGTYTYNGETITAELRTSTVDFKTPTPSNLTGKGRYISLTSISGQTLFLPLAGQKGDKSSSNNPSLGQGLFLWSNSLQGATGGWAWGVKYWPGSNSEAKVAINAQLQAEGFGYVRCVKK